MKRWLYKAGMIVVLVLGSVLAAQSTAEAHRGYGFRGGLRFGAGYRSFGFRGYHRPYYGHYQSYYRPHYYSSYGYARPYYGGYYGGYRGYRGYGGYCW